jgi:P27 family predicted phage terminase small subunit
MKDVGVYEASFDKVIDTLAGILEQRDAAYEAFLEDGRLTVERVSDRGSVNMTKNPLLTVWQDLNTQALAYWKELGLTPAAYKKMVGDKPTEKGSALVEALRSLGA